MKILSSFFPAICTSPHQNGVTDCSLLAAPGPLADANSKQPGDTAPSMGPTKGNADSGSCASSTHSPAKLRPCRHSSSDQEYIPHMEVSDPQSTKPPEVLWSDSIVAHPTTGKPVSDTALLLMSLHVSLKYDLLSCFHQYKTEVQELGDSVGHIEEKMCEMTTSFNILVDSHASQQDDPFKLNAKLADLEERSCHNNLTIQGIPESSQAQQLSVTFSVL